MNSELALFAAGAMVPATNFLLLAWCILVNGALRFFAEHGLEGSATSRSVKGFLSGPTGMLACEIAEFHRLEFLLLIADFLVCKRKRFFIDTTTPV